MSVLLVVSSPNTADAPDSAPRRIVKDAPAVSIEVVQFSLQDMMAIPHIWVRGTKPSAFEATLSNDPHIREFDQLHRSDDGMFYQVKWDVDSPLIHCVVEHNGFVMDAQGTNESWSLMVWFIEKQDASSFQECCISRSIPLEIIRVTTISEVISPDNQLLTEEQRTAFELAYERGYFDEPRRTSQQELAAELNISASAFGSRLRRGYSKLIEKHVLGV